MSVNAVKGKAALHLSRELGAQYKTAWVLSLKIKEALGLRRVDMKLDGQVQMDGKYAGGHIKPENKADEPKIKSFSLSKGAEFLDQAAVNWSRKQKCASCHTNVPYLIARPALKELTKRCLDPDPLKRYADAHSLQQAMNAILRAM